MRARRLAIASDSCRAKLIGWPLTARTTSPVLRPASAAGSRRHRAHARMHVRAARRCRRFRSGLAGVRLVTAQSELAAVAQQADRRSRGSGATRSRSWTVLPRLHRRAGDEHDADRRREAGLRRRRARRDAADDRRLIEIRRHVGALISTTAISDDRQQQVHHRPMISTWKRCHLVFDRNSSGCAGPA